MTKTRRLLNYLKQLSTLRTTLKRKLSDNESVLWMNEIPHEETCFTRAWYLIGDEEIDYWVKVSNPTEPDQPIVPEKCKGWIDETLLGVELVNPKLKTQIVVRVEDPQANNDGFDFPQYNDETKKLEDHPEVQDAWDQFIQDEWIPWVKEYKRWKKVHGIYSKLFEINQTQLKRGEDYELVIGLGLLDWTTPNNQRVKRHLIVANARLDFEPHEETFTVYCHPEGSKLRIELDMLDTTEKPTHLEDLATKKLSESNYDPWNKDKIEEVLKTIVSSLNAEGRYYDTLENSVSLQANGPIVNYAPAIILRSNSTKGLTKFVESIIGKIDEGCDIPPNLIHLAEENGHNDQNDYSGQNQNNVHFEDEIYFPKLSNPEQLRIVEKLNRNNGVLVQGPPGTGKSHTIANLVCHLLATGNKILITAKTPRALQVLLGNSRGDDHTGLIPEELKSLCISILNSGVDDLNSLQSSINSILQECENWNQERTERKINELQIKINKLRQDQATINNQLKQIRESETHSTIVVPDEYVGTRAKIAQKLEINSEIYGWIEDNVSLDTPLPIDNYEFSELIKNYRCFSGEKEKELNLQLPTDIESIEKFESLVLTEKCNTEELSTIIDTVDHKQVERLSIIITPQIENILELFDQFKKITLELDFYNLEWVQSARNDIIQGNTATWFEISKATQRCIQSSYDMSLLDDTEIQLPKDRTAKQVLDDVNKVVEHIDQGGSLGWFLFRPKIIRDRQYLLKQVCINGQQCHQPEQLKQLKQLLTAREEIDKAWTIWRNYEHHQDLPYLMKYAKIKDHNIKLNKVLSYIELFNQIRAETNHYLDRFPNKWFESNELNKIITSLRYIVLNRRKDQATAELQVIANKIKPDNPSVAHPITNDLLASIQERNTEGYQKNVEKYFELLNEKQKYSLHQLQVNKLNDSVPNLINNLKNTCKEEYWENRVNDLEKAWNWAKATTWLDKIMKGKDDSINLELRYQQITYEINHTLAQIASLKAWSHCIRRINENPSYKQQMIAWQKSMEEVGAGKGKYVNYYMEDAQNHLEKCRNAVPAWVMPLHRIWDSVDPLPQIFDVVIVDEASQCGFEALPLLFIAKKILIVGDDKQISPEAVGLPIENVHELIREYLYDFEYPLNFGVRRSLFDHGKQLYVNQYISLREHFRCMPEIIHFSNDLCYAATPLIPGQSHEI